jgi:multidrug efflux pump subunit AcrA (membrane-fusion protein)
LLIACNRGEAAQPHDRHEHSAPTVAPAPEREPPRRGPPGYAETHLEPDRIKALGITRATVERKSLSRVLRTSGIVTPDETRSAHVHAKVRGFLEGLRVNFVGQRVRRGEALCFVYSQDVVAAELELLAVLDNSRKEPAIGELARAEKAAHDKLLAAARRRLSLWDVPRSEIARLEKTLEPSRTFPLVAPRDGVVTAKAAVDGMFVEPNIELYTIADLSRVWVLADLYEADVPFVRVGDTARVRVEGRAEWIEATIAFLPPTIDQATRTMKARVELDNADRRLSPGAFVSV